MWHKILRHRLGFSLKLESLESAEVLAPEDDQEQRKKEKLGLS